MRIALRLVSYLGLALSVIPPALVWAGKLSMSTNYMLLNLGMALWFSSTVLWIKPDSHEA